MRDRIEQSKLRRRFENDSDLQPLVVRSAQGTPRNTTQIVWRRSLVGYSGRFIPGRSLVRIRSPLPYGSLAQLVRASALQAGGHRFESCSFHHLNSNKSKYGPMVKWSKTSPFHGGNPSSNLGRVTTNNLTWICKLGYYFFVFFGVFCAIPPLSQPIFCVLWTNGTILPFSVCKNLRIIKIPDLRRGRCLSGIWILFVFYHHTLSLLWQDTQ